MKHLARTPIRAIFLLRDFCVTLGHAAALSRVIDGVSKLRSILLTAVINSANSAAE
jgi:hypothetical protein